MIGPFQKKTNYDLLTKDWCSPTSERQFSSKENSNRQIVLPIIVINN